MKEKKCHLDNQTKILKQILQVAKLVRTDERVNAQDKNPFEQMTKKPEELEIPSPSHLDKIIAK